MPSFLNSFVEQAKKKPQPVSPYAQKLALGGTSAAQVGTTTPVATPAPAVNAVGTQAVGANSTSISGTGTKAVRTPENQAKVDAQAQWDKSVFDPTNADSVALSQAAFGNSVGDTGKLGSANDGMGVIMEGYNGPEFDQNGDIKGYWGQGQGGGSAFTPSGATFQSDANSMWSGMMADHDAGLEGKLQGTYADEALNQRRMSEMNALEGGGVGGAFAGGTAQVALGGQQNRLKARNDHLKQGLEMKMARLQQLIKQAEANKDRNLMRELQAEADKTQMAIAGMHAGQNLPPGSGGSGGASKKNSDGSTTTTKADGSKRITDKDGEWIETDSSGRVTDTSYEPSGRTKNIGNMKKWRISW